MKEYHKTSFQLSRHLPLHALILHLLCLLMSPTLQAQSWQWGRRGGSSSSGLNPLPNEAVYDMATDSRGNVYLLALAETSFAPDINGTVLNGYGGRDIVFASFSCNGVLRWQKTIGSYAYDIPVAVRTDAQDHIYITGNAHPQTPYPLQFGTDTTLAVNNEKALFVAQYDTTGHLNWLSQPQPDTCTIQSTFIYKSYDITVDPAGNAYVLTYLYPGPLSGSSGFVITAPGAYILKYSPQGTIQQVIQPDMNWTLVANGLSTNIAINMVRMSNGNFVVSGNVSTGTPPLILGGQAQAQNAFIACFTPQGQLTWHHHSDSAGSASRPAIDAQDNIYLCGGGIHGAVFNGHTFVNSLTTLTYIVPFIMKIDAAGNAVWAKNGGSNANASADFITLRGGDVTVVGSYPGKVVWDGYTWQNPPNTGYDLLVARFDKQTGSITGVDSLKSNTPVSDYPTAIASDNVGNMYIGGKFAADLQVGSQSLASTGGDFDFFVARYGYACNCIPPVAGFTKNVSGSTVTFTYNGTSPADSVRWNFGDGQSQTRNGAAISTPAVHTYTGSGNSYTACVTVYTSCGSNQLCQQVQLNRSGIGTVGAPAIVVYPNPVHDQLHLRHCKGAAITVYDLPGRAILQATSTGDTCDLDLSRLAPGSYTLMLQAKDGRRQSIQLYKD